jgi:hypothetical protein
MSSAPSARLFPGGRLVGVLLTVLAGALSAWASWRTWILPFVDSSREMNVPARLVAGERLYRDVVYYYGPAGPWINAAAVAAFGRRFASLEVAGLVAAAVLFASLAILSSRAGTRLSAIAACVWAAALAIGAPNGGSFLFPYSFGALDAFAGAFVALAAAAAERSKMRDAAAAGGFALALLAKPEIGFAAGVLLVAASLRARDRERRGETKRAVAILGGGTLLAAVGWAIAVAGIPGSSLAPEGPLALFSPPAEWRNVYRVMSGLANPGGSMNAMATALFLDLGILGMAAAAGSRATARAHGATRAGAVILAGGVAAAFAFPPGAAVEDRLPGLLVPLPLVAAAAAILLLRAPLDRCARARFFLFGFAALAGSRVVFGLAYGRITTPYSVLAFPGLAAAAAVLAMDVFAVRLPFPGGARAFLFAVFLGASGVTIARGARFHPAGEFPAVATPAGVLRLPAERADAVAGAFAWIRARARPGDGLAGFPEAGLFNFALGLPDPLREEQVLPGHLDAEREALVARRIETAGPRFLLLANQPTAAFGPVAFGRDYARELWRAVEQHYSLAASFGEAPPEAPVGDPRFFLRIYERFPAAREDKSPGRLLVEPVDDSDVGRRR